MHQYTGFFHGGSRWKIRNVALPCGHRLRKIFQSIVISDDFCNPQLVQKRFVADSFSTSLVKNVFRTPRPHSDLPFLIISFFVIFSAFFFCLSKSFSIQIPKTEIYWLSVLWKFFFLSILNFAKMNVSYRIEKLFSIIVCKTVSTGFVSWLLDNPVKAKSLCLLVGLLCEKRAESAQTAFSLEQYQLPQKMPHRVLK